MHPVEGIVSVLILLLTMVLAGGVHAAGIYGDITSPSSGSTIGQGGSSDNLRDGSGVFSASAVRDGLFAAPDQPGIGDMTTQGRGPHSQAETATPVPEPSSLLLLGSAMLAAVPFVRHRRRERS